jgi:hypothetical protein
MFRAFKVLDVCYRRGPHPRVMDVPALFEDLQRVFPDKDPGDVLRRNPSIAYQVHGLWFRVWVVGYDQNDIPSECTVSYPEPALVLLSVRH